MSVQQARDRAERIEQMPCPSCGRDTLAFFHDPHGEGAQCVSMDCLQMFDAEELEPTP